MLSKKQARAFFLGGTLVTFLIFIGLTIFSLSKGQDQSNEENLTDAVVRGKEIWEKVHITHLNLQKLLID